MFEIERKFLVTQPLNTILKQVAAIRTLEISQVYLQGTGNWTQRVRTIFDYENGETRHVFTMKQKVNDLRCVEIENTVSEQFMRSFALVGTVPMRKSRYEVLVKDSWWHVDVFLDPEFGGLIVAEIELKHEDAPFSRPSWIGKEVTKIKKYKNVRLARKLDLLRKSR